MAKINRVDHPVDFKSMCIHSSENKENNDCAVKAVAIVCGVSYREAKEKLNGLGRKDGRGTHRWTTEEAIKSLGFSVRKWSIRERLDMIATYPSPHDRLHSITSHHPRRFPKSWEAMEGKSLLLFSRGHVLAYKNGMVQDWSINKALRIREIWEISNV